MMTLRQLLKTALVALPLMGLTCHAGDKLPLPDPLPGEQWVDSKELGLEDQFAPMLPMPDGSVLVFSSYGNDSKLTRLWPSPPGRQTVEILKNMSIPSGHQEGYSKIYPARYASVASSAGIWLVGATVELIRFEQPRLTGQLLWPRNNPKAVALDDGSIVVFGSEGWNIKVARSAPERRSIERVSIGADGRLVSEFLPPLPCVEPLCDTNDTAIWNFAALHLGGGRIMLAGGGYRNPGVVYLYEPSSRAWRTVGRFAQGRSKFTLTLLPDGQVLAAGGNEDYKVGGMTTELWDPKTEQWSLGPLLPVPMREHTAVLKQGKTVLLAGGRFAGVLAWDIGAPSWRIVAQHAVSRARGGVVVLPNDRLAIIGGWHARIYGEGWGRRTPGYSVVDLAPGAIRSGLPIGLTGTKNGAFAVRGSRLFVAGGLMTSTFDGSVQEEATALVEVMQAPEHKVMTLPALPFGAKEAQAVWIDDVKVLVLARGTGDAAPSWFGIIDTQTGVQTQVNLPATIAPRNWSEKLKLIGISDGKAWFIRNGSIEIGFDLTASAVVETQNLPRSRVDFKRSLRAGHSTAILHDGRAAELRDLTEEFRNPENPRSPIVRKTPVLTLEGKRLPLPPPMKGREDVGGCRILAVVGPGDLLAGAVFFGVNDGNGQLDWWWTDANANRPSWQQLGSAQAPAIFPTREVRLNWGGRRIVLFGGEHGIAAFDERDLGISSKPRSKE
ncbi:MAG: hypothetical protein BWY57_01339 [Betaproteobacteria bacterium ADurb.Bin341]|nr:MAG: hypothetical protein BWY57_01339 [Betaproteobacteria bacterium ADurb.Bin341]